MGSLDMTIPRYNDIILLLLWHFVISGFHCINTRFYYLVCQVGPSTWVGICSEMVTWSVARWRTLFAGRTLAITTRSLKPNHSMFWWSTLASTWGDYPSAMSFLNCQASNSPSELQSCNSKMNTTNGEPNNKFGSIYWKHTLMVLSDLKS